MKKWSSATPLTTRSEPKVTRSSRIFSDGLWIAVRQVVVAMEGVVLHVHRANTWPRCRVRRRLRSIAVTT